MASFAERRAYPPSRLQLHHAVSAYMARAARQNDTAHLHFICTHNSRRSHMAHLWAAALAWRFLPGLRVACYSGGTEATALHPNAKAALEQCGFEFTTFAPGPNPVYQVRYAKDAPPIQVWSKRYDDATCPRDGFAAIMTCSEAYEACPVVPGAALRVALSYPDPKESDGTEQAGYIYHRRALEIGAELWHIFTQQHL